MSDNQPVILTPPVAVLRDWVRRQLPPSVKAFTMTPLAGDAGSRCYYRVAAGSRCWVASEDSSRSQLRRFVAIAAMLAQAGVRVPAVVSSSSSFLLLEDFGDDTYLARLNAAGTRVADRLYTAAFGMLVKMQRIRAPLPTYDAALLRREMNLFPNWYCRRHLRRPLSAAAARTVAKAGTFLCGRMLAQRQVFVHRDYHSRNLLVLSRRRGGGNTDSPGVVDFQDAVVGAAAYDIASLLRDAYVEWSGARQESWLATYWRMARDGGVPLPAAYERYREDFNVASVQRGLKVLGVFARLTHRDNKPRYLNDLPLVHRHLLAATAALPALKDLELVLKDYPPLITAVNHPL